jgi:predicted RNase H-like nuclease (RuvC/YqgF family)
MPYDDTEFVDRDFPVSPSPSTGTSSRGTPAAGRAPTREELDAQVTANQQQLAKLREAQEQLERARAELEEMRRRRADFQQGRTELREQLTRGIGLLEKADFDARRDSEQLGRSLDGLRSASSQIESLHEESWTDNDWNQQLSRALTVIENARMELNSARLKWPLLDGNAASTPTHGGKAHPTSLADLPFKSLLRLGFALTWPIGAVGLVAIAVFAVVLLRR